MKQPNDTRERTCPKCGAVLIGWRKYMQHARKCTPDDYRIIRGAEVDLKRAGTGLQALDETEFPDDEVLVDDVDKYLFGPDDRQDDDSIGYGPRLSDEEGRR